MTKTEGEEEHVCSSFFQSLSEAPPQAFILFCLTPRSQGRAASFCITRFSNHVPISESWRKERAEEGEQIKWQRACKHAGSWWGGRVPSGMDNPHHPKAEARRMEESVLSQSRWPAAGAGPGRDRGNMALGLCCPMQWGDTGCLQGEPSTRTPHGQEGGWGCDAHAGQQIRNDQDTDLSPQFRWQQNPLSHPSCPQHSQAHVPCIHWQAMMAGAGWLACSVLTRNQVPGHCEQNDAPYQAV